MKFSIFLGKPLISSEWERLLNGHKNQSLSASDELLFVRWGKAMAHLALDPFYPGLHSHEIKPLTARAGLRVFESYLENHNPQRIGSFGFMARQDKA
jgi:hypothetical protein